MTKTSQITFIAAVVTLKAISHQPLNDVAQMGSSHISPHDKAV